MFKLSSLIALSVLGISLVNAVEKTNQNTNNDGWGDDNLSMEVKTPLIREKRGGYIQQQKFSGGSGLRGPAAGLRGGYRSGGGSLGGYSTGSGSLPGPSSLYSYAPRRANAAVYGGIHGPQTSEEALKFDSHLTRSMIADALASQGHHLYQGHGGVISAAIQSRRNIQFYDVPSTREDAEPLTIEVGASPGSLLNLRFKSASSALVVDQDHESSPGSVRQTSSEDEPHRLVHTVTRPIYQEVHEVIKPFRKITQEIQPIQEDIQTIVAKGDDISAGGALVSGIQLGATSAEDDGGAMISGVGLSGVGRQVVSGAGGSLGGGVVRSGFGGGHGGSYGGGASYSSGYVKPAGYSKPAGYGLAGGHRMGGAGYGSASGFGGGQLQQVQIPFARRAAAGAARAAAARRA